MINREDNPDFLNSFLDIISINLVVGKINIIFIIIYYFLCV